MTTIFYRGYENDATLTLVQDGATIPTNALTKVALTSGTYSYDSVNDPTLVALEPTLIRLRLGLSDLPIGTHSFTIIVFSPDHPDGIIWAENTMIQLKHA